jgi:NADPH:quinone reductase-like Zn-dependent oxidoreductase
MSMTAMVMREHLDIWTRRGGPTMGSKADLLAVLSHIAAGRLEPIVHPVLPLARAADAHRMLEARAAFGKIVLEP